ncbi:MAG: hypothetical protein AAF146_16305, partial [Bacteroidota bacterium]
MTTTQRIRVTVLMIRQTTKIGFPGPRPIFLSAQTLQNGPSDDWIELVCRHRETLDWERDKKLLPMPNKDFIQAELNKTTNQIDVFDWDDRSGVVSIIQNFDLTNTYAVARTVLDMYQETLQQPYINSSSITFDYREAWGSKLAINIYAHEGEPIGVYKFNKQSQINTIELGRWATGPTTDRYYNYICRDFDGIAHEAGHAVFRAIRSDHYNHFPKHLETKALEESFADLTCILALLYQMDVSQAIIADTCAEPRQESFLTEIAESLSDYRRSIKFDSTLTVDQARDAAPRERRYKMGLVFSNALFHFTVELFEMHVDRTVHNPVKVLYETGKLIRTLVIRSLYETRHILDLTFGQLAKSLGDNIEQYYPQYVAEIISDNGDLASVLTLFRNAFSERGIAIAEQLDAPSGSRSSDHSQESEETEDPPIRPLYDRHCYLALSEGTVDGAANAVKNHYLHLYFNRKIDG